MKKASQSPQEGRDISIEAADKNALPAILSLLERNDLPKESLTDHLSTTLVAREERQIVGSAALELYGKAALLRSVVVEETLRGQGLGHRLTHAALDLAIRHEVATVYLLTMTAEKFFSRLGFHEIPRSEVPTEVQRSVEFASACPVTATVMIMHLNDTKRKAGR
jgi:amino-acid N-acetyltransferase